MALLYAKKGILLPPALHRPKRDIIAVIVSS